MNLRKYEFRRLLLKNFRTLLLLFIPILFLSSILLYFQVHVVRKTWKDENKAQILQSATDMDLLFSSAALDIRQTAYRSSVYSFFTMDHSKLSPEYKLAYEKLQLHLMLLTARCKEMDEVFFYCAAPEYYVTLDSAMSFPAGPYDWDLSLSHDYPFARIVELFENDSPAQWLFLSNTIYYYQPVIRASVQGGFLLRFSNQAFNQRMSSLLASNKDQFFLINESRQIIASSVRPGDVGKMLEADPSASQCMLGGKAYSIFTLPSALKGHQYVLLSERAPYLSDLFSSLLLTVSFILLFLLFCLFITYLITLKTCRPYELILELLRMPNLSDQQRLQIYESRYASLDDLGMISTLIFQSHNENASLQSQVKTQHDLIRSAQRKALQAQINPHFLINTLEGFKWSVLEHLPNNQELPHMISALAQLLKANLELNSPMTSIEEEVHQAQLYLKIQQYRFKGLFDVVWDVDSELFPYETIRFSLQPLIENAINHGIKKAGGGTLLLSIHPLDDHIRFLVQDDGVGIEAQVLETLKEKLLDSRAIENCHIGLMNVNARLQLIFGMDYHLEIESRPGKGTSVVMIIPRTVSDTMPEWAHRDIGV